jgi:SAM-dependent methyltransferase
VSLAQSDTAAATRANGAAPRVQARLPDTPLDYLERNRAAWERWAPRYAPGARKAWESDELRWGIWEIPESDLRLLDDLHPGADVIELGCGTASISAWLARLGFRPVGVDFARAQLETAERFEREFGLRFPLLRANAEELHFDHASFDLAISDYGASLWCDPRRWVGEAGRVLKPGGRLVFITNSAMLMACTPSDGSLADDRLVRDYFSDPWVEFGEDGAIEFHLSHGDWVRLLRAEGFVLENLIETRPPPDAQPRIAFASMEWARRWPTEEIWVARSTGARLSPTF